MNNKVILKIKLIISLALLINWMAVIYYLSSQIADVSSVHSQGLIYTIASLIGTELKSEASLLFYEGILRETAHGVEFAILSVLSFFTLKYLSQLVNKGFFNKPWFIEKCAFIFCFLYACSDEVHQLFVPGRAFEIKDIIIDSAGIIVGILTSKQVFHILQRD